MLAAFVYLYRKGSGTSFYFDEWNFVLDRIGTDADTFLQPHNEHLSLVPVAIYKVLFATAGLDDYGAYRAVALVLHLACALLLYLFVRPRVGPALAVVFAALLLFLGAGYFDVLWPFQIGYLASLAAGLGALLALERASRGGDVAATLLLVVSVASSGLGIPMLLGAAAYLLCRPDRRSRLWVVAVPAVLYAAWYLGYGKGAIKRQNATALPRYAADEVAAAMGAVAGLTIEWGRILAVGGVALVAHRLATARRIAPSLVAVLVAGGAFWLLNGLARAQFGEPGASRYVYPGALFVLLIAAELLRSTRVQPRVVAIVGVLAGAAILSGLGDFQRGGASLREIDRATSAELAAVELAGKRVSPEFQPDTTRMPQVRAGDYLRAIDHYGESPALPANRLASAGPDQAALADKTLLAALGIQVAAVSGGESGDTTAAAQPRAVTPGARAGRHGCVALSGQPGADSLEVVAPPGGLSLRAGAATGAAVFARRFARNYPPEPLATIAPGAQSVMRIPSDGSSVPWRIRLSGATVLTACGVEPAP
jgi:hypothetical protein